MKVSNVTGFKCSSTDIQLMFSQSFQLQDEKQETALESTIKVRKIYAERLMKQVHTLKKAAVNTFLNEIPFEYISELVSIERKNGNFNIKIAYADREEIVKKKTEIQIADNNIEELVSGSTDNSFIDAWFMFINIARDILKGVSNEQTQLFLDTPSNTIEVQVQEEEF